MPFIFWPDDKIAAGQKTTYPKRPAAVAGGRIIILRITAGTDEICQFAKWSGYLYNQEHTRNQIALYQKWLPESDLQPQELFKGHVEWPQNFLMKLQTRLQAADKIYYCVEYDVQVPPPGKKWW